MALISANKLDTRPSHATRIAFGSLGWLSGTGVPPADVPSSGVRSGVLDQDLGANVEAVASLSVAKGRPCFLGNVSHGPILKLG